MNNDIYEQHQGVLLDDGFVIMSLYSGIFEVCEAVLMCALLLITLKWLCSMMSLRLYVSVSHWPQSNAKGLTLTASTFCHFILKISVLK